MDKKINSPEHIWISEGDLTNPSIIPPYQAFTHKPDFMGIGNQNSVEYILSTIHAQAIAKLERIESTVRYTIEQMEHLELGWAEAIIRDALKRAVEGEK